MIKIRVRDLAKELNKTTNEVIHVLKMHGIYVESHNSLIPDDRADKIRDYYKNGGKIVRPAAKAPGRPAARPARGAAPQPQRKRPVTGGIDSNGNFVMSHEGFSFDGRSESDKRKSRDRMATKAAKQTEDLVVDSEKSVKIDAPEVKEQSAKVEPVKETAPQVKEAEPVIEAAAAQEAAESNVQPAAAEKPAPAETSAEKPAEIKTEASKVPAEEVKEEKAPAPEVKAESKEKVQEKAPEKTEEKPAQKVRRITGPIIPERPAFRKDGTPVRPVNREILSRAANKDGQGKSAGRDEQRGGQGRGSGRDEQRGGQGRGIGRDEQRGQSRNAGRDEQRGQGRGAGRDEQRGQNRNAGRDEQRGGSRSGQGRSFGADSGRDVKAAAPSKESSRENRRNINKDRDNRRDSRYFEENEKSRGKGSQSRQQAQNKKNVHKKPQTAPKPAPVQEKVTSIVLPDVISLKDFADLIKVPATQIIKKLFMAGKMYNVNSDLSYDEAEEIALDYDILCEHEVVVDVIEEMLKEDEEREEDMVVRPPVVCVMGHVDHGKTSILDAIRKTRVTAGEAGGITQHIGAYVVDVNGQKITFLDTPGHEAFTAMRLRGAQSTDIAILVVAADDGVMPQTIEAINHAKAAEIDIIVAINKIDKPSANIDRVKQELTEYGLVAEDWGGDTIMVPVSAHTGEGLDELLDMILLDAEVKELKANPNRRGRGLILEAQLDKGRGPVATVLVQKGTINVGDHVTVGTAFGRIRAMIDDNGKRVKKAGPSMPVEILGLNDVPNAGEVFIATETEKEARSMAETFIATNREKMLAETKSRLSLDSLFEQIQEGQIKDLNIIVKADVQGSVEAVKQSLAKLSNEEVAVRVIHGGVGAINESDVTLASASNAIIIGFNVRPDNQAKQVAEQENVDVRLYRVIYNAIEDIEAAMKGMLEPEFVEKIIGHAEVRQTYKVSGVGTIIGGYVKDGQIVRGCKVRLLRDNVVIHDGELASLKRFKDDVKEVNSGYECGMSFEKYNDIKEGDQIEAYVMEEVPR